MNRVNSKKIYSLIIIAILILLGFAMRLLPHPANFTPILAIALFAGLYLPRRWAIIAPILAMLISDVFIGFYDPKIMLSVYLSFAVAGLIGLWVRKRKKFSIIVGAVLLGSIIFFLVTNAAVWAFSSLYAQNFAGLIESYTMGLPFFKNSLLGNLFYVGIMVGSVEYILAFQSKKMLAKEVVE